MINFSKENLKGLHFFVDGLNFPVAIATYDEWQETQVSYLANHYQSKGSDSESICKWCISHNISYQILYPLSKRSIITKPYKYIKYLQLKKKLNNSL